MFGTVSKWIGVYNIWYYGVFMALNGKLAYCMPNLSILPIVAVLTFLILSAKWYSVVCSDLWSHWLLVAWSRDIKQQKLFFFFKSPRAENNLCLYLIHSTKLYNALLSSSQIYPTVLKIKKIRRSQFNN